MLEKHSFSRFVCLLAGIRHGTAERVLFLCDTHPLKDLSGGRNN